jgi:hypothetical protein
MEGGLSDRALRVLRELLHEKIGSDLGEMPDPALVADHVSHADLARRRNCGPVTLAEIRRWLQSNGWPYATD